MCEVSVYCLITAFELHIKFSISLCVFDFYFHLDMYIFTACKPVCSFINGFVLIRKSFGCTFA